MQQLIQYFYGSRYLEAPPIAWSDDDASYFRALLQSATESGDAPFIPLDPEHPPHTFLRYIAEHLDVLLHGSGNPAISEFVPREGVDYMMRPIRAVYATDDGLWPMFFAIVDRTDPRLQLLWNACEWAKDDEGQPHRIHFFALNEGALTPAPPWRNGTVYLLPKGDFHQLHDSTTGTPLGEWISEQAVHPIARLAVTPADWPFLEHVITVDIADLDRHQLLLSNVTRSEELADGYILTVNTKHVPVETVQQAASFLARLNPGWRVTLARETAEDVAQELHFPAGAIAFFKERLRADFA